MMTRITITQAAQAAIEELIGMAGALDEVTEVEDGRLLIWLPNPLARTLAYLRLPGEDYSQTIVRITEGRWP